MVLAVDGNVRCEFKARILGALTIFITFTNQTKRTYD